MEILRSLSDDELMKTTKESVARERELTTKILRRINEIEARRLHVKIGFSSLHECLVKYFHYSDGGAHRRISAARLLKRLPDAVAPALAQGQVNLTTIAAVQDFLVAEKKDFKRVYSSAEATTLVFSIVGKSRAQCEKVFQGLSPQRALAPRPEFTRAVQAQGLEIRFTADQALQTKLTRLREILSHHPDVMQSYAALIDTMATKLLKRIDPLARPLAKKEILPQKAPCPSDLNAQASPRKPIAMIRTSSKNLKFLKILNRYIPAAIRRQVYVRDQGRCCYVERSENSETAPSLNSKDHRCTARHYLHIDHVIPVALGGTTILENLRLLCAAHNQMEAVSKLGRRVMAPYLDKSTISH